MTEGGPTRGMIEIRHVAGGTRAAYDELYAGRGLRQPEAVWRGLLEVLDVAPGMRLLDVACGEGQLLHLAARLGLEAHGVDISPVAVSRGAAPGVLAAVADGERLPYPDGAFDRVVSFGSLEHYEVPEAGAAEIARVLDSGGRALFQLPNAFGLRWSVLSAWRSGDVADDGQPLQRYATRRQWERLLEGAGLRVVTTLPFEDSRLAPRGIAGVLSALRHPTRFLIPMAGLLPVNMASMFLFVCVKASPSPTPGGA